MLLVACGGGGGGDEPPAAMAATETAASSTEPATPPPMEGAADPIKATEADPAADLQAYKAPTPYGGTPAALPGHIDAVRFDYGGQNVAYKDNVPGNAGGQFRPYVDVDIVGTTDSTGGGYTINNFETGEWLKYTVKVASSGKYDINLHAASMFTGSAFHVEVDGVDVTGRVTVANTGGWETYRWAGKQGVSLTAGTHVLKIVSDQQYFNLNAIKVSASTTTTPPATPPATVAFLCSFLNLTDCGFGEQSKVPGRATIAALGRDGLTSLRLTTLPGDTYVYGSGDAERTDVALSQAATDCYQGREQWWAHSIMFPSDYVPPAPGGWGVVMDFHHTGSSGQANFHVDAMPQGLRLRGYGGASVDSGEYIVDLGPVTRNQWYDFVYHVKWSSGTDGYFDAWVNGVKKLSHRGPTLYQGMGCYLKLANYHTATGQASSVIHDRVVRGRTAAEVSPTPLQ